MYHIKQDKRSVKSAQLLCDGLSQALEAHPYKDISISDICSSCGVARSTFYRLFDTLDDVLLYQFDSLFQNSLAEFEHSEEPYAKVILRVAIRNKPLLHALVSSGRTDLFDFTTRSREDDILQHLQLDISSQHRLYCTPMLNAMMCAVIRTWLANGCCETVTELYHILTENLLLISQHL